MHSVPSPQSLPMTERKPPGPLLAIGAVERETGVSKETLRVWERRYAFPQPQRDPAGERLYPQDQVDKLRLVKCVLDQGHRPGKVIGLSFDALRALVQVQPEADRMHTDDLHHRQALRHYIALCKSHRVDDLRHELSQILLRIGLQRFVADVIAPLTALVGEQWANGQLAIFEEHLYTESVQVVLRQAIATVPATRPGPPAQPRIVLTTLPMEQHSLGLLMAEAIFALEGASCISLGTQTPVGDMAQAARSQNADIVALSCSAAMNPNYVLAGLHDLRCALPAETEIWVGGNCPVLRRRPPEEVRVVDLQDIADLLASWRRRHRAETCQ